MYVLTKEGEEYLKNGLPEKNLVKILKEGAKNIDDININKKNIAIAWAKRNGWIAIGRDSIELTNSGKLAVGEKTDIEKALKDVKDSGKCDKKHLKILIKRKLVKEVKEIKKEPAIKEISQLTPGLIKTGKWKVLKFKRYDVRAPAPVIYPGKRQPYLKFLENVKEKLIAMGFVEAKSPLVELELWNFDVLFQAQDHPAREVHDTFNLKTPRKGVIKDKAFVERIKKTHENGWITKSKGWKYKWNLNKALKLVLRSQTTATSARFLYFFSQQQKEGNVKMFCIDRVFRPDVIDKTHLIEFDQAEGIIMADRLNFRHLIGILKEFAENVIGCKRVKFIPSYYPFTEPSVDMAIYFDKLKKWVEVAGAGLFRPEMLAPLGINKPVLAWGIGITRLALLKLKLDDIRYLFAEDLEWMRRFPVM